MLTNQSQHFHLSHLINQEEMWRSCFLYNPLSLLVTDLQGYFQQANRSFFQMIGIDEKTFQSQTLLTVTEGSQPALDANVLGQIARSELRDVQVVKSLPNSDQMESWFKFTISLMRNDEGEPFHFMVVVTDITDHYQTEINLKNNADRYKTTVTYTHLGVCLSTLDGVFIEVNPSFARMVGLTVQECVGRNVTDFTHPDYLDATRQKINDLIAGRSEHFRILKKFIRKDGSWLWGQCTVSLTHTNGTEPPRMVAICEDLTDQVRIEEGLRIAERRSQIAAEAAQIGTWDYNLTSKTFVLCDTSRGILGLPVQSEYTNAEVLAQIFIEDQASVLAAIDHSCNSGENAHFELTFRIVKSEGKVNWVQVLGQTLFSEELENRHATSFTGALLNVTDSVIMQQQLKAATEAAEKASAAKSIFLTNMSHEIRTPLGAMLGFTELLKSKRGTAEDKNTYIDTILRNGYALLGLVDDLLDLSKVEAGQVNLENIDMDIHRLIREVETLFLERGREKNIQVNLHLEDSFPRFVRSDPTRIRQILINLVGNAIKFTVSGHVDIIARGTDFTRGKLSLLISIRDTGIGLSPNQISKIFQPFRQADNSTTRRFGGSGLGLFLSKKLANALGGDITVSRNENGRGCTFVASLVVNNPLRRPEVETTLDDVVAHSSTLKDIRVLLAEDAMDNQLLVTTLLEDHGARVDIAENGEEAVRIAFEKDYDIVLMDLQMPKIDGYEATRMLRRDGYKKPIVALTAHAMSTERKKTKDAGFNGHLTKPLNARHLIDTVLHFAAHN